MKASSDPASASPPPAARRDGRPRLEHSQEAIEALQSFRIIIRSVRRHFREVEERCGISGSQLWALSVIADSPGIRVKDLARSMAIQQSTASNLVEALVRREFVRRARESQDERIVQLHPTPVGQEVVDRAPKPLVGLLADVLSRLDPKRLAMLNGLLDEIVSTMHSADRSARHTPLADI